MNSDFIKLARGVSELTSIDPKKLDEHIRRFILIYLKGNYKNYDIPLREVLRDLSNETTKVD